MVPTVFLPSKQKRRLQLLPVPAASSGALEGLRVAVKVVRLMNEDGGGYSSRSLDSLKQEIQVRPDLSYFQMCPVVAPMCMIDS